MNLNPRSIYNKVDEFCTFVEEEDIDIVFISESHERWYPTKKGEHQTLNELISLEDHIVISNPNQRKGKGGRPALVINKSKYTVKNLTQTDITIPWGVEIVWTEITPLNVTSESNIQKIILAALYCKPGSRKKTALIDHISEVYQLLSSKYNKGLHWIIAGDFNELKDQKILEISHSLKQVVAQPTRLNPPSILDKIITSLHSYYQVPEIKPPLDSDPDKNGKSSDHKIVIMTPINVINNQSARITKVITYRPLKSTGMDKMQEWFQQEGLVIKPYEDNAHEMAKYIMETLKEKTNEFFPFKTRKISSNNQPFFSETLSKLKRKKQREYNKKRKSMKWKKLDCEYRVKLNTAKMSYYKKEIASLKKSDPKNGFIGLKDLCQMFNPKNKKFLLRT